MQDRSSLKKIAVCGVFVALSAVTGLLESFLPLELLIPLPGVKLGIANIFITAAYYVLGPLYAFAAALLKVIIVFLFSGNSVSLALSASGAAVSFVALMISMRTYGKVFSFIGISVLSAVFHGMGQALAALLIVGSPILFYIPVLGAASAVTGALTGVLMNLIILNINSYLKSKVL